MPTLARTKPRSKTPTQINAVLQRLAWYIEHGDPECDYYRTVTNYHDALLWALAVDEEGPLEIVVDDVDLMIEQEQ